MDINWLFSKTYLHKCPDGTTKRIHKNIDNALPLVVKEVNQKFETEIKGFEKLSAKLKADYADKIKGLLYSINEQNQSLILNFRISYVAFQADPCDDKGFLKRQATILTEGQQRLVEFKVQIVGLTNLAISFPSNSDGILKLYTDIIGNISKINNTDATIYQIKDNRETAKAWIGGNNE